MTSIVNAKKLDNVKRNIEIVGIENLLTPHEVVQILRLDSMGLQRPLESLRYLRRTKAIGFLKVAGKVLYPAGAIQAYIEKNRRDAEN